MKFMKKKQKNISHKAHREKKDVFHELIVEAMENVALANAIREGEKTEKVSKKEIFNILERNA